MFESSKEILLSNGDENARKYVSNFINDFLGINDVTASFFKMNINNMVNKRDEVYNVKSYQKSNKYRPKVFNKSIKDRKKVTYNLGGRKRYFHLSNTEIAAKKIIKRYDSEHYFKGKLFYILSNLFLLFLLKK